MAEALRGLLAAWDEGTRDAPPSAPATDPRVDRARAALAAHDREHGAAAAQAFGPPPAPAPAVDLRGASLLSRFGEEYGHE